MKQYLATPLGAVKSLSEYKEIHSLLSRFTRTGEGYSQGVLYVTGLSDGLRDTLCASLLSERHDFDRNGEKACAMVVCAEEKTAYAVRESLCAFGLSAEYFPVRDYNFHNVSASSHEWEYERLRVLRLILSGSVDVVVTVPEASLGILAPPESFKGADGIAVGDEMSRDGLCEKLISYGYNRADIVEGQGQFAVRGDILDVFIPDYENPVRMEFFGDEIDSLGFFDVMTQRRVENADGVCITPIREQMPDSSARERILGIIDSLVSSADKKKKTDLSEKLRKEKRDFENGTLANIDKYLPLMYDEFYCLFDYVKGPVFVCDYPRVRQRLSFYVKQISEDLVALAEAGEADIKGAVFCLDENSFKARLVKRPCLVTDSLTSTPDIELSGYFDISSKQTSAAISVPDILCEELSDYCRSGYKVQFAVRGKVQCTDMESILKDRKIECVIAESVEYKDMKAGLVYITPRSNSDEEKVGFECRKAKYVLLCDDGIGSSGVRRSGGGAKPKGASAVKKNMLNYSDLTIGDFVVHEIHGIGVYDGIKTLTTMGITRDYITIRYYGSDSLYVPCDQLDKVSKFSGKSEGVRVSRLGSGDWAKTKARVRKATKDIAKELIALYAERTRRPGYSFSPDSEWQREFEDRFEYEETDGQLDAVKQIKRDMEKPCPMDRLLCGDVGFGKTEVALRAAFKAVMDGKQVAILVPTTVLCWQHYRTILARMQSFPIKVEMLSRYSKTSAKKICDRLKKGDIDIVVGTHKLLAKGIEFKDLGLLIVDEEQRFGVTHKERLKEMSKQVDVLTLSATPIPRTFNMALVGIRDMSVLEEAPIDRHPVQTYVLEHDDAVIEEAVKRELRRAGQVFYLHNRVDDIEKVAARLREAVPDASIAVAHGKMTEAELSDAWKNVVEGKTDILVCTTIIETGVDVPNANTLIIEDADKLGLAQLHQLRGRVGRSSRRAYAYFTFRADRVLNETAVKRLEAIREFTEFGSGFKIAMRDLEIRGAGNLLGAEQSGHMESVGYDLFVKLLERAVLEEKGEVVEEKTDCTMDIRINAYIPEKYIKRPSERIDMYKRIAGIETKEDADDVIDELLDRYGDVPKETDSLIKVALSRRMCEEYGFEKVEEGSGRKLVVAMKETPPRDIAFGFVAAFGARVFISTGDRSVFTINMKQGENSLDVLEQIFNIYSHTDTE